MSQPDSDRASSESSRRILSALADGDATDGEAARAFQAWRDDAGARAAWHSYQLIGDVLRSEDLASEPRADEAFLVALRARLADEPVVLAPQPRAEEAAVAAPAVANAGAAARSRARWQGPVAMAATTASSTRGCGASTTGSSARRARSATRNASSARGALARSSLRSTSPISW